MKKTIVLLLLTLFIGVYNISLAQSIVTDRPDQTESSVTVPKGSFQIETGLSMHYESMDEGDFRTWSGPSSLFRLGITKFLELRITSNLISFKNIKKDVVTTGVTDIHVGAKLELYQSKNGNSKFAILSHLVLPTGSFNLTDNAYGTVNRLIGSQALTNNIGVGYNIGYDYYGVDNGNFVYTLSLGFSITDKLGVFVEGYGEVINLTDNYTNFDAGFTYLIKNNLQYDFSFGTGITHNMNFISTGISWNIGGYN